LGFPVGESGAGAVELPKWQLEKAKGSSVPSKLWTRTCKNRRLPLEQTIVQGSKVLYRVAGWSRWQKESNCLGTVCRRSMANNKQHGTLDEMAKAKWF